MPLEPCLILLVESPALVLERLGREKLLVRALPVVEQVEKGVRVDPPRVVQSRVVEDGKRFLRVVKRRVVRILRFVVTGLLGIGWFWTCCERGCQKSLYRWGWVIRCTGLGHFERLNQVL